MTDEELEIAYTKYRKTPIHELKKMFPQYPPIHQGFVSVDRYPGSDHDGEIFDEVWKEWHFDVGILCGWAFFNPKGLAWLKSLIPNEIGKNA